MENAYVILGATGGVGQALTQRLAKQENTVVIKVGRNADLLAQLYPDDEALTRVTDLTSFSQTQELFAELIQKYKIIGVAHCVGSILLKPASFLTEEEWHNTIKINLNSAFNVVAAITKHVKQDTSIVLFSSAAASIGLANHEAIAAAKAGVEGLARAAAASYATKNLRFNVIAPGLSEAKMSRAFFDNPKSLDFSKKLHPLGRLGTPDKLASLAEWLLNQENDWLTGEVIHCDGGLATVKLAIS
jgi:NAD(P)-dependent dehydrogenase (short-subunit alcohol dehydrogenase family)